MDYALFALFMIMCIIISMEIIQGLLRWIFREKTAPEMITVFPIRGGCTDVEYIVRYLMWKKENLENPDTEKIILADLGADEETVLMCKKLMEDFPAVEFCKGDELSSRLQ